MINIMHSSDMPMNQVDKCLDPQLWHACAGGMAQIPPLNSKVYYFPQGHAEHANKNVDFGGFSRIPPLIPCRVSSIKYLADSNTDEVFAKIKLVPLRGNERDIDDEGGLMGGFDKSEEKEKPNSFAKTLTQSDANNGGGFSVPRYCAETIFPRLDYSAEPPVQTILAKDVHNEVWKFRHIYRGTPRRHLLTTGWSNFVNRKKLVAGDSIVFLRAENGDLCIGIRRAKMGIGGGPEVGWNTGATASLYGGGFENGNFRMGNVNRGNGGDLSNVRAESVVEAANLAVSGREFEVVYYPRASAPEFVVRASAVRAAMRVQWCVGMRFKMAFETEDSSRISWFMGTIASVQVDDPIRWPNSPWRLLQVAWDEPDLLQNVKRVSPWLVELVSNIPPIHHPPPHLSPFSPPRKRARIPQHSEFQQFPISPISPLCCLPDSISAGIQGARHAQYLLSSSDLLQLNNLQTTGLQPPDYGPGLHKIGSPNHNSRKNPTFRLFGQSILTEQQMSQQSLSVDNNNSLSQENVGNLSNGSGSAVIQNSPPGDEELSWFKDQKLEMGFETGHCKVFVESEDVGRTLDLTTLNSFEELYGKLAAMFGISRSEMLSNLVYSDAEGTAKHAGDEPFSVFSKKARRLTILMDSSSDNRGN